MTTKKTALLLGAGGARDRRLQWGEARDTDFLNYELAIHQHEDHDLNILPYPWVDEYFDEIHAYEVLEHTGMQGDPDFFFGQFKELNRILKPGGYIALSVPRHDHELALGVPDHKRVLPPSIFVFLDANYESDRLGIPGMGDYRKWRGGMNLKVVGCNKSESSLFILLYKPKTIPDEVVV